MQRDGSWVHLTRISTAWPMSVGLGVTPKGSTGKWRLIENLSAPEGHSVNDGIREDWCSLSYVTVDDAVSAVQWLGQGSQLAKVDLRSAYRIVPVHPNNRPRLGDVGGGIVRTQPFRSGSDVPLRFSTRWQMRRNVWYGGHGMSELFHYLDYFVVVVDGVRRAPHNPPGYL